MCSFPNGHVTFKNKTTKLWKDAILRQVSFSVYAMIIVSYRPSARYPATLKTMHIPANYIFIYQTINSKKLLCSDKNYIFIEKSNIVEVKNSIDLEYRGFNPKGSMNLRTSAYHAAFYTYRSVNVYHVNKAS